MGFKIAKIISPGDMPPFGISQMKNDSILIIQLPTPFVIKKFMWHIRKHRWGLITFYIVLIDGKIEIHEGFYIFKEQPTIL